MRTRRRTAEVLLSRPLHPSKPAAGPALPFPLAWAYQDRPLSKTLSHVLASFSATRGARRLPPERARRVSFLSPVGIVGAPASASEESRSNGLALSGSEERDEGQEFGHNLCGSVPRTSRPRQGSGLFRAGVNISEDGNGPDLPPGRGSQSTGGFDIK